MKPFCCQGSLIFSAQYCADDDDVREEICRLRGQLHEMEQRISPTIIIESLIKIFVEHYSKLRASLTSTSTAPVISLASKFYCMDKQKTRTIALPHDVEDKIENLWLSRVESYTITCDGDAAATLSIHPSKVHDDLPLPVVTLSDGTIYPVLRRVAHRTPHFWARNDPNLAGVVMNSDIASDWSKRTSVATSSQVVTWPAHADLDKLFSLWLNSSLRDEPTAVLTVDGGMVRLFVDAIAANPDARCHFTCSGEKTVYGYFVLVANDDDRSDLQRLFVGSFNIE